MSGTPLQQDVTGIGRQLHRWQDRKVRDAATTLLQWSRGSGLNPLFMWSPMATGASVPDAHGALIAVNTLVNEGRWHDGDRTRVPPIHAIDARQRYRGFDPID